MNYFIISLFIFCGIFEFSFQQSTPHLKTYRAGVVEFSRATNNVNINLEKYKNIINNAQDLDIIVFPEATLSNDEFFIPNSSDEVAPCQNTEYDQVIQDISCSARTQKTYVVVNLIEKSNCTSESQNELNDTRPCAANGLNKYNTNVVFNRTGHIISRYRKFNPFGEPGINTTLKPDISTFTTDFNVTFGHFICFDLIFASPPIDLISLGITDFIYPTMWFSELPFLTAVQYQQNWAYTHNVNFLAAGASNPLVGSTGTGIYAGRLGPLVSVMNFNNETKMYSATVPKRDFQNDFIFSNKVNREIIKHDSHDMLDLTLLVDDLKMYKSLELDIKKGQIEEKICYNEFCCDIFVKISLKALEKNQKAYKYRLIAFDGVRSYGGVKTGGERNCGIIACIDNNIDSCGKRFNKTVMVAPHVTFNSIVISGRFEGGLKNMLTLPSSVDTSIMPLYPHEFSYIQTPDFKIDDCLWRNITYQLLSPKSDLLSFAIYGRNFQKDGMPVSFATNPLGSIGLIIMMISLFLYI